MLAYLAGAIEYSPDLGRQWRRALAASLRPLGYEIYDPAEDERKNLTAEEQANLRAWKTGDLARYKNAVRKIIQFDLQIVARSTCVICLWDEYAALGGGTSAELTFALQRGTPVYMVTSLPTSRISGWILACCSELFPDFDALTAYLRGLPATCGDAQTQGLF